MKNCIFIITCLFATFILPVHVFAAGSPFYNLFFGATLTWYPHLYSELLDLFFKGFNQYSVTQLPGPFLGQLSDIVKDQVPNEEKKIEVEEVKKDIIKKIVTVKKVLPKPKKIVIQDVEDSKRLHPKIDLPKKNENKVENKKESIYVWQGGEGGGGSSGEVKHEEDKKEVEHHDDIPPPPPVLPPVPPVLPIQKVLISEISVGTDSSDANEFVELYNPGTTTVDLIGWALKSGNATATSIDLISHDSFVGTIAPKSFFLIGHQNYVGLKLADLFYSTSSQDLSYASGTVSLYNASDTLVDLISWVGIPKNGSIERKALSNNLCINAENEGKFLGNGCDTVVATGNTATSDINTIADFEIRILSDPQNKDSLPEPRVQSAVANFNVSYTRSALTLALNWATSTDASGSSSIIYILKDISAGATTTELTRTNNLNFSKVIKEVARDYRFSIQALDREGLMSVVTEGPVAVPPLLTQLDFYNDATSTKNYLDLSFANYPFVPAIYSANNSWKLVVFYKNSDPGEQSWLDVGHALRVDDITNVLPVNYYNPYSGNSTFYSLALPDVVVRPVMGAGVPPYAFEHSFIEDNRISLTVPSVVGVSDYVTTAFYDYSLASFNDSFRLVALDKTKHYFSSTSPINLPPTIPGNLLVESYSTTTGEAIISFDKSTDPDGLDPYIKYDFKVNEGEWYRPVFRWVAESIEPNHDIRLHLFVNLLPGQQYLFGVRALDIRGQVSGKGSVSYETPL